MLIFSGRNIQIPMLKICILGSFEYMGQLKNITDFTKSYYCINECTVWGLVLSL